MFAAVGLAEFGIVLTPGEIKTALADARPELVANFFQRFVQKPTLGALFVMRQALVFIEAPGRLVVLKAIARAKESSRNFILIAALDDESEEIRQWAEGALASRKIDEGQIQAIKAEISKMRHRSAGQSNVVQDGPAVEKDQAVPNQQKATDQANSENQVDEANDANSEESNSNSEESDD